MTQELREPLYLEIRRDVQRLIFGTRLWYYTLIGMLSFVGVSKSISSGIIEGAIILALAVVLLFATMTGKLDNKQRLVQGTSLILLRYQSNTRADILQAASADNSYIGHLVHMAFIELDR